MYNKRCPNCCKKSYSSGKKGEWTCPYCGEDLTNIEAKEGQNDSV